jgi:hypothetical protein
MENNEPNKAVEPTSMAVTLVPRYFQWERGGLTPTG